MQSHSVPVTASEEKLNLAKLEKRIKKCLMDSWKPHFQGQSAITVLILSQEVTSQQLEKIIGKLNFRA